MKSNEKAASMKKLIRDQKHYKRGVVGLKFKNQDLTPEIRSFLRPEKKRLRLDMCRVRGFICRFRY
jgi:hypothetical protein